MRGENHPAGKLLRVPFKYMNMHRPRCVVMENVAALFKFKKYRKTVKKIIYHMKSMGYVNYYKILNSLDYGVRQRRLRVYMVSWLK